MMRRFLVFGLLSMLPVQAQDLVFLSAHLDAFWLSGPQQLVVQSGRSLHVFRVDQEGPPHLQPGFKPALPDARDLALATFLDVRAGGWIVVTRKGYQLGGATTRAGRLPQPFFRSALRGAPQRLPLLLPGGRALVPVAAGFLLVDPGPPATSRELVVPRSGAANLGWGLGDDMVVTETVPYLLAWESRALLAGHAGSYSLHPLDRGAARTLEPAPLDDRSGILDIPYAVRPLLADFAGSPDADLLLVDPSAGTLMLYSELGSARPRPTRIMRLGGLVLATWSRDLNGDGRADLSLLRTANLNPIAQLRVIQKGRVRAELLVYLGRPEGLPKSPDLRRRIELPLRVGIQNGIRTADLPQLCQPVPGPALVMVDPQGRVYHLDLERKDAPRELGHLLPGRAQDPFQGVLVPGGRLLFGWRTKRDSRLYSAGPFQHH